METALLLSLALLSLGYLLYMVRSASSRTIRSGRPLPIPRTRPRPVRSVSELRSSLNCRILDAGARERLVAYQRRKMPKASEAEVLQAVLEDLERDNRSWRG